MSVLQRRAAVRRGPRFYREGENVMFETVLDASTRSAARIATQDDILEHPKAYQAMDQEPVINPPPVTMEEPDEGAPDPPPKPHATRRQAARGAA